MLASCNVAADEIYFTTQMMETICTCNAGKRCQNIRTQQRATKPRWRASSYTHQIRPLSSVNVNTTDRLQMFIRLLTDSSE